MKKMEEELEKCKSFSYFFEHYCTIVSYDGSSRRPNEYEIKMAKLFESGENILISRARQIKTPEVQIMEHFKNFIKTNKHAKQ